MTSEHASPASSFELVQGSGVAYRRWENLYAPHVGKITFFPDAQPVDSFTNNNQLQVAEMLMERIGAGAGRLFGVMGPMSAGKSTVIKLMSGRFPDATVLQHTYGFERYRKERIVTHAKNGHDTGVEAVTATTAKQILAKTEAMNGGVLLVDEGQFFDLGPDFFRNWREVLESNGVRAVLLGLDTSFQVTPWITAENLLSHADAVAVMAARCPVSGEAAWLTRRLFRQNGSWVQMNEGDLVVVGGVEPGSEAECTYSAASFSVYENQVPQQL